MSCVGGAMADEGSAGGRLTCTGRPVLVSLGAICSVLLAVQGAGAFPMKYVALGLAVVVSLLALHVWLKDRETQERQQLFSRGWCILSTLGALATLAGQWCCSLVHDATLAELIAHSVFWLVVKLVEPHLGVLDWHRHYFTALWVVFHLVLPSWSVVGWPTEALFPIAGLLLGSLLSHMQSQQLERLLREKHRLEYDRAMLHHHLAQTQALVEQAYPYPASDGKGSESSDSTSTLRRMQRMGWAY